MVNVMLILCIPITNFITAYFLTKTLKSNEKIIEKQIIKQKEAENKEFEHQTIEYADYNNKMMREWLTGEEVKEDE